MTLWKHFVAILVATLAVAISASGQQAGAQKPLSEEEKSGRKLFVQRCALCHLPIYPEPRAPIGPALHTYFGNLAGADRTDREDAARKAILNGTLRMPGFQYTFTPEQIDSLIAYLKRTDDVSLYYRESGRR